MEVSILKIKHFFYRPIALMLAVIFFVFAPLGAYLDSRTGKMQSKAFVLELAAGYTIWEILSAYACALLGVVITVEVVDLYNSEFRGLACKKYFDTWQMNMAEFFVQFVTMFDSSYDLSDFPDLDLSDYDTIDNTAMIMDRYYQHLLDLEEPLIADPDMQDLIDMSLEAFLDQLGAMPDDAFSGGDDGGSGDDGDKDDSPSPVENGKARHEDNQALCNYLNYIIHCFEANSTFYQPGNFFSPGDDSTIILSAYTINMLVQYALTDYSGIKLASLPSEVFYTSLNDGAGYYTCRGGGVYEITDLVTGYSVTLDLTKYSHRYAFAISQYNQDTVYVGTYRSFTIFICDTVTDKLVSQMDIIDPSTLNPIQPTFTINYKDEFRDFLDSVLGVYYYHGVEDAPARLDSLIGSEHIEDGDYKSACKRYDKDIRLEYAFPRLVVHVERLSATHNYINKNGTSAYTVMTIPSIFDGIPMIPIDAKESFGKIEPLSYRVDASTAVDVFNKSITVTSDDAIQVVESVSAGTVPPTIGVLTPDIVVTDSSTVVPDISDTPLVPDVPVTPVDPGGSDVSGNPDMDSMKTPVGITDKFPFCVPFDLIDCVKVWNVQPKKPVFEIPFEVKSLGIKEIIVVDLTVFDSVTSFLRFLILLSYIAFLVVLTRNIVKG